MSAAWKVTTVGHDGLGTLFQAVCKVPGCDWTSTYRHQRDVVVADAEDHEARHRRADNPVWGAA